MELYGQLDETNVTVQIEQIKKSSDLTEDEYKKQIELFELISNEVRKEMTEEVILSLKTNKGDTQKVERVYISRIKEILDKMGLTYKEAGSQQSKDFRDVGGIGLNIEVKKTDSDIIYFNDTCPAKDINYIIINTGKTTKTEEIKPQIVFTNGEKFTEDSQWVFEYLKELDALRDKYARGGAKKNYGGCMSVYPRPTFKACIKFLLQIEKIEQKEANEAEKQAKALEQEKKKAEKAQAKAAKEAEKQAKALEQEKKKAEKAQAKEAKEAEKQAKAKKQQVV
jgi:hypothetical protein